ncbi:thioesterase [Oceanicola sp. 22II-s10i]|uniref:thioesterase family protein n=1 Tax=Oceanicola sp. 22II-s10i TaxID=1317116 RepID=UPI000B524AFE|nr:thioesterase family protein [Oceanicola sp. 22II-s10i]OWU84806.1 thioesterase [Oceanicola sp. 22II-s10i]
MELISPEMTLRPEWIDHNGHLNMAFYGVLFDTGCSFVFRQIGFGPKYREATRHTTFAGEFRVRYIRELKLEDKVRVSFRMLEVGPKAFHYAQELRHVDGWLAATGENISLHIDKSGPRVAPYPPEIMDKLLAIHESQKDLPPLDWVGRPMGLRKEPA